MPAFDIMQRYSIKIEYLLTWYPIGETPNLDGAKMYGNVVERSSANFENPGLGGGTYESVGVGGGWTKPKPFDSAEMVWANIEFGVPAKSFLPTFEATASVRIGHVSRTRKFVLPPDTTTPTMLNVHAKTDEPRLTKTGAVFQAVFITSPRIGIFDVVQRLMH